MSGEAVARDAGWLASCLLAMASHELKAPLANIKGYVSTLLADDVEWEPADRRAFLQIIESETDRLSCLVAGVLEVSRIESGALVVERAPAAVPDLVEGALAGLPPEDRVRLRLDLPSAARRIDVDRASVETVLRNLVDNALKFSEGASPVDVTARWAPEDLRITVRDRGAGVPEELRGRLFEPFVRDDRAARSTGGFGLGLAICRSLAEAHGGRVTSRPERPGTSFELVLPVSGAPSP